MESVAVDAAVGSKIRDAVLAFLRGREPVQAHVIARAVASAVGCKEADVYPVLRGLRDEGLVVRAAEGDHKVWSLVVASSEVDTAPAEEPAIAGAEEVVAEIVEPEPEPVEVDDAHGGSARVATSASLTNRTTVRQLVAVFQKAEADIRAAFAQIATAEDALNAAFTLGEDRYRGFRIETNSCHHSPDFANVEPAIEKLRRQAWQILVERLEIKRAMSIAKAEELDKHLEKAAPEPITEATVNAFVLRFAETLDEMFGAAVVEVFDWLRPHAGTWRDGYKTNQKNGRLEVGERLVLTGMVCGSYSSRHPFQVNYGYGSISPSQRLTALWNVFSMLDGKGIGEKTNRSPLENAILTSTDGTGTTPFFAFRAYRNGNLHLHFLRPDLLRRFNQIAGGKRLRPEAP